MVPALTDAPICYAASPAIKGPSEYDKDAFGIGLKTFDAKKELNGTKQHPPARYPNVRFAQCVSCSS